MNNTLTTPNTDNLNEAVVSLFVALIAIVLAGLYCILRRGLEMDVLLVLRVLGMSLSLILLPTVLQRHD
jgi:hypothetical protein